MSRLNLPHSGAMVLIDEVLAHGADFIEVAGEIRADNAFLEQGKFATYKAIEMMAQSLGAYKGIYGAGDLNIGFLISVREFEIYVSHLQIGDIVRVRSQLSMQELDGFGVWSSELFVGDEIYARANLSVLSPSREKFKEIKDG